jgi:hypothetical protein
MVASDLPSFCACPRPRDHAGSVGDGYHQQPVVVTDHDVTGAVLVRPTMRHPAGVNGESPPDRGHVPDRTVDHEPGRAEVLRPARVRTVTAGPARLMPGRKPSHLKRNIST